MIHLSPSQTTYRAKEYAELFYDFIYRLHGPPARIISDHDMIFTSTFWQRLHELMKVDPRLSTAYHPETDGSTERFNRTVSQMLRNCVALAQSDWAFRAVGLRNQRQSIPMA